MTKAATAPARIAAPRPRRLLHVFSTFAVGGPQVRFAQLANALGRRYEHVVVAMDGDYACGERLDPELAVSFPRPALPRAGLAGNALVFRRLLRGFAPDLLATYNWGAIEWAAANLLPVCAHLHVEDGFGPQESERLLRRRVMLRRFVLPRADRVVLPSRTLYAIARDRWRLPEARLAYVPNGIDCARFAGPADPDFRPSLGLSPELPLIGTVAGLRREKNLSRLLSAFAAVAVPAALVVAGDGPERPRLEAEADALGIAARVRFLGRVAQPETVLRNLDLFALTSDTEQMPYGVIEAMAAGLAVVSTDVGDVRLMVEADNAPFVGPPEAGWLAARMTALLGDAGLRRRIGAANRRKANAEFAEQRMIEAWDRLFAGTS